MKYRNVVIVGFFLAACGGEENIAAPVAPVAPGTPSAAVPGAANPAVPGTNPAVPAANAAGGQTRTGVLGPGDQTLQTGEYAESFTFNWNAGETHPVLVSSTVFDPYVIVRPPVGEQVENDDLSPPNTNAGLTVTCATTGQYTVVVTSFEPGEAGAFNLTVQ